MVKGQICWLKKTARKMVSKGLPAPDTTLLLVIVNYDSQFKGDCSFQKTIRELWSRTFPSHYQKGIYAYESPDCST